MYNKYGNLVLTEHSGDNITHSMLHYSKSIRVCCDILFMSQYSQTYSKFHIVFIALISFFLSFFFFLFSFSKSWKGAAPPTQN